MPPKRQESSRHAAPALGLPPLDDRLFVIHYSQELGRNSAAQTPPVSAIIVQSVLTVQQLTFSSFRIAEARGFPLLDDLPGCEKEVLGAFNTFVQQSDATFVHWSMKGPRFGFDVLEQRSRVHGLTPAVIPLERRFDLAAHLKAVHGENYADHPRLYSAMRLNGLMHPEVLDEAAGEAAWAAGEFNRILMSLGSKVDAIRDMMQLQRDGRFQVANAATTPAPLPADEPGRKTHTPPKVKRDRAKEARDKWIYQRCKAGDQYKEVARQLRMVADERGWDAIRSVQGIRQRAIQFAQKNGLQPLPRRIDEEQELNDS